MGDFMDNHCFGFNTRTSVLSTVLTLLVYGGIWAVPPTDIENYEAPTVCEDESYFACNSGHCIMTKWKCDGDEDCVDKSDEDPLLCKNSTCGADSFECTECHCIPQFWVCDGDVDCARTGADEAPDLCPSRKTLCEEDEFLCEDGGCVPEDWVCDHDADCPDGSDENANC